MALAKTAAAMEITAAVGHVDRIRQLLFETEVASLDGRLLLLAGVETRLDLLSGRLNAALTELGHGQ